MTPCTELADRGKRAAFERVPHVLAVLADVDDREAAERSGVVRLTAAGRIEGGAIERDGAVANVDDGRVELCEICVGEVDQLGRHDRSLAQMATAMRIRYQYLVRRSGPTGQLRAPRRRLRGAWPRPLRYLSRSRSRTTTIRTLAPPMAQLIDLQSVEPVGKPRVEVQPTVRRVRNDAEEQLHGERRCGGRPRLRDVGLRIRNRPAELAFDAAEQLRQARRPRARRPRRARRGSTSRPRRAARSGTCPPQSAVVSCGHTDPRWYDSGL